MKQGFFVGLTDLFGDGAFAKDGHRFATFLQSAVPYARALERAWGGERSRLGLDNWDPAMPLPKGPLSTPVDMAGIREEGGQSLQHAICEQAEKYDVRQLELELKALPSLSIRGKTMPDPRLAVWMEHDKVTRGFAYDYPHGIYKPSNDVFAEMFAEHLGICSPVAERIGVDAPLQLARNDLRNPPTVDKWGFALSALSCPGDDWRTQHDER